MTLTRRSLMAAIGALTAAPAAVTAKQIEAAAALDFPTPTNTPDWTVPGPASPFWDSARPVREALWVQRAKFDDGMRMPPHIAGKRSWSPAFKDSRMRKEYWQLQRLLNALDDESSGGALLKILMGESR
jgi:hypothetical protein